MTGSTLHRPDLRGLTVVLPSEPAQAGRLGGKGAALDRLLHAGLPVPPTVVLTTDAYRQATSSGPLAELVRRLRTQPVPPPREHAAAARAVDDAFTAAVLPLEVCSAVLDSGADLLAGGRVAVRSSATTEDLHGASFAGQYRSSLDVDGPDALLRAVRLTWASLWHPAPRSYRRFRGIVEDDVAMAVIVMRMVPAELSGVAFTTDPTGNASDVRVEVVHGLAEALVSGRVTPRAFVVPRAAPRRTQVGAPAVLGHVVDLALAAETAFGEPQDVEWAWDGATTWLVQSRPVTTPARPADDDGFDTPVLDSDVSTVAGIAEMLPGVLPPLVWEVDSLLLEQAFRALFADLRALPDDLEEPHALVRRVRGRAALDLCALGAVAAGLPRGSEGELEGAWSGELDPDPGLGRPTDARRDHRQTLVRSLLQDVRVVAVRHRASVQAETSVAAVAAVVAARVPVEAMPTPDLLAYRARLLDLAGRAVAAEVAVAAGAVATYQRLESVVAREVGPDRAGGVAQRLTAHAAGRPLGARLAPAGDVPAEVRTAALAAPDWPTARTALVGTAAGAAFVQAVEQAWRDAGSAAVFAGRTWTEQPSAAWSAVRAWLARDASVPDAGDRAAAALTALERELRSSPRWRLRRVVTGQVVDLRLRALRRTLGDTVELLDRRERTKAAVLALGGEVRRTHLELGQRLAADGRLEAALDVDHLSGSELVRALHGEGPALSVVAQRRRWLQRCASSPPLPRTFVGRPALERTAPAAQGDRLVGWAAAPGVHVGPACLVDEPSTSCLQRGDVLVARSTDASWAPLFLLAGAVVVEDGGPLSHAAVVARELGLPAVVNVPGLVDRLRGRSASLTVDGDTGTVLIGAPAPAEPAHPGPSRSR